MVAGIQHLQKNSLLNVFGVTYKWKVKHVDYIHCIETHTVLLSSHSPFSSAFSWD